MTLNWFIVDPTKPEGFKVEKPWSIGGVEDMVSYNGCDVRVKESTKEKPNRHHVFFPNDTIPNHQFPEFHHPESNPDIRDWHVKSPKRGRSGIHPSGVGGALPIAEFGKSTFGKST